MREGGKGVRILRSEEVRGMVREDGEKSVGVRTYRVEDSEESEGVE